MTIFYYKTSDRTIVEEFKKFLSRQKQLSDSYAQFAREFNADRVTVSGMFNGYKCSSLIFKPVERSPLWTKPDRLGSQRPVARAPKGLKEEHNLLKDRWKALKPEGKLEAEPLLATLGKTWGDLFFNSLGLVLTEDKNTLYITTSWENLGSCTECLASEYLLAKQGAE